MDIKTRIQTSVRSRLSTVPSKSNFACLKESNLGRGRTCQLMLLNSFTLSLINSYKLNVDFHKNYTTQQKNDDFSTYLIGLYLVQPVDTGEIADFITRFKMEPVRFAVAEITKQLTSYSNDDIISDEIKINLT
jgi:hypothetical protein